MSDARTEISSAARRRVASALDRHGMLLVQGPWEIPSLADLIAGKAVTTRGYSWDYAPAWRFADALRARDDVASAKLFRGRNTLVAARLWPALTALASAARAKTLAEPPRSLTRAFLELAGNDPGIAGSCVRSALDLDARAFQRVKARLEQRLCVFGVERDDTAHHTHESHWYSTAEAKFAAPLGDVTPARAAQLLRSSLRADVDERALARLFPVLGFITA